MYGPRGRDRRSAEGERPGGRRGVPRADTPSAAFVGLVGAVRVAIYLCSAFVHEFVAANDGTHTSKVSVLDASQRIRAHPEAEEE